MLLAAAAAWAAPEDLRFSGGSFDGWDRNAMASSALLGGADVSLSSGTNQTFDFTAAYGALATSTLELDCDGARDVYDLYALTVRAKSVPKGAILVFK